MNTSLLHTEGCVMAAIDPSLYAESVARYAGWAAERLSTGLELLHAIDRAISAETRDLSGSLSLGTQEALLAELATLDERRAKLAQEHGRMLLEDLRVRIAADHGVRAGIRQRHGSVVESLLDVEAEVRLFVIGKRGEHADFAKGHLGSNLERVIRAVHRPVLVASRAFKPVRRFLIAFDGSATTRQCVEMVCASPLLKGMACDVVMAGDKNDVAHQEHLQWAQARLQEAGFEPQLRIIAGSADTIIPQQVGERAIDLLVMGAYGHSRIRTMVVGSTTTHVLRTCQIPVLLLR